MLQEFRRINTHQLGWHCWEMKRELGRNKAHPKPNKKCTGFVNTACRAFTGLSQVPLPSSPNAVSIHFKYSTQIRVAVT